MSNPNEMPQEEKQRRLLESFLNVLQNFTAEYDLTNVEVLGVIQFLRLNVEESFEFMEEEND